MIQDEGVRATSEVGHAVQNAVVVSDHPVDVLALAHSFARLPNNRADKRRDAWAGPVGSFVGRLASPTMTVAGIAPDGRRKC